MNRLFSADGIRGIAGDFPVSSDACQRLGASISAWLRDTGSSKDGFLVGCDTRISSQRLKTYLCAGLTRAGIPVVDVGIIPTAGLSYLIASLGYLNGGAIITASHNPVYENGIKIFDHLGSKLSDKNEEQIEELYFGESHLPYEIRPSLLVSDESLCDFYIDDLVGSNAAHNWDGIRLLIDCSNGAGSQVYPQALSRLGVPHFVLNADPNGININQEGGSEFARSNPDIYKTFLENSQSDLAIVVDGDADRLVMIDRDGKFFDGNQLLAMLALDLHRQQKLKQDIVVTTHMSNSGLVEYLAKNKMSVHYVQNGDKYITETLVSGDLTLGGEAIGHMIVHDNPHHLTGDALRAGMSLVGQWVDQPGSRFGDLASGLQKWPQLKVAVFIGARTIVPADKIPGLMDAMHTLRLDIPDISRLECRPASTEPVYRIMIEARDTPFDLLVRGARKIIRPIQQYFRVVESIVHITDCETGKQSSLV